jgi:hypothetical protein
VLTLAGDKVCAITRFGDSLFPQFGLPRTVEWSHNVHREARPARPRSS